MSKVIQIGFLVVFILFLQSCKDYKDFIEFNKKVKFDGIVTEKRYESWNHGRHFIIVTDKSGETYTLELTNERRQSKRTNRSITWETLNVNYQVIKDSNDLTIKYKSTFSNEWKTTTMRF